MWIYVRNNNGIEHTVVDAHVVRFIVLRLNHHGQCPLGCYRCDDVCLANSFYSIATNYLVFGPVRYGPCRPGRASGIWLMRGEVMLISPRCSFSILENFARMHLPIHLALGRSDSYRSVAASAIGD